MPPIRIATLLLFVSLSLAALAAADDGVPFAVTDQEEYQNALAALETAPGDERALVRYANAATRVGNLEAAIATLERILALEPRLSSVRLELAVLYARIRATDFARVQAELVRDSPDSSTEVRERAIQFLEAIDRQDRFGVLTGSLSVGVGYQTNANAGTDSSVIREGGFDFRTPRDRRERDDFDAFVLGAFAHVWDVGSDHRVPLETRGAAYFNRQFDVDEADIGAAEVTSGPRLQVLPSQLDRVSIRPFALVGFTLFQDDWNSTDYGGGLDVEKRLGLHSGLVLTYTGRRRDFDVEDDRTGFVHRVAASGIFSLTTDVAASIGGSFAHDDARASFKSNDEGSVFVRGTLRYDAPFEISRWPWQASVQLRWIGTSYDAPDARVDPFVERHDDEYEVIARNTFWLSSRFAFFLEASYLRSESNLSVGEFDNTTVAFGSTWSF